MMKKLIIEFTSKMPFWAKALFFKILAPHAKAWGKYRNIKNIESNTYPIISGGDNKNNKLMRFSRLNRIGGQVTPFQSGLIIILTMIILVTGCTKLGEPTMHPSDWNDPNSENSHMAKISVAGTEGCKACHGGIEKHDYFGGTSGVSCDKCHAGGPSGHPAFNIWVGLPGDANFHGKDDKGRCKACHGQNLRGGITEVSCYTCHETF